MDVTQTKLYNRLPMILLAVFFAAEAISKYQLVTVGDYSDITKYLKGFLLAGFLLYTLLKKEYAPYLILLLLGFAVGQYFLEYSFVADAWLNLSRHLFLVLMLLFFGELDTNSRQTEWFFNLFEALLVLNALFILAGALFDLPLAKTYTYGNRFGYNGFFVNSTTGTYALLIGLMHLMLRYGTGLFKKVGFYIFFLSLLLVGTKVLYLSMVLFLLYYAYTGLTLKYKNLLLLCIVGVGVLFFYISFLKTGIFNEIRQESGIWSAIFSFRNDKLLLCTLPYIEENWTFVNYLFGGVADFQSRPELGLIDIFFFFGLIGAFFFFVLLYKGFITFKPNRLGWMLLLYLVFIIAIAGNFFNFASVPIYALILRESLKKQGQPLL